MPDILTDDHHVKCAHCGRWHALEPSNPHELHPYTRDMRYVRCRGAMYYVGHLGTPCRWPLRRRND